LILLTTGKGVGTIEHKGLGTRNNIYVCMHECRLCYKHEFNLITANTLGKKALKKGQLLASRYVQIKAR